MSEAAGKSVAIVEYTDKQSRCDDSGELPKGCLVELTQLESLLGICICTLGVKKDSA